MESSRALSLDLYRPGNGGHAAAEAPEYGNVCHQFSSFNKGGFACDQDVQQRTGNPSSVGPVYILASKAESSGDPTQKDFWLDGAGQAFAVLAYDQCSPDHNAGQGYLQHSYYSDTAPIDRARPCRGCFTIPWSMDTGLWVFQVGSSQQHLVLQ
ncbi:hypothetical protein N2152v2_001031 [Parachlorella kessleri]